MWWEEGRRSPGVALAFVSQMSVLGKRAFAGLTPCLWQKGEGRKDPLTNRDGVSGAEGRRGDVGCGAGRLVPGPGENLLRLQDPREERLPVASECSGQDGKHLRPQGQMTEDQVALHLPWLCVGFFYTSLWTELCSSQIPVLKP